MAHRIVPYGDGSDFCQIYVPDGKDGRPLGSASINKERVSSQDGDCGPGSNMTFGKNSNGTFSVVCTYKHKPKKENSTVGSTGSSNSANKHDAESSSPNGLSAGGGGGGGRSSASHATTPDSGKQGGGNGGGGGQGGTTGGGGQGGASGQGDGGGGQDSELPEVPESPFGKGDGEPNWGGLKSNGDFGTFKPSSDFSTGGQCPQDILLDFGQFGSHSFSWSPICEAAQRLRYVFITLSYFVSAMMVFRTVNSMKG